MEFLDDGKRFCHELEIELQQLFASKRIRVVPKNEGMTVSKCGDAPSIFTIEVTDADSHLGCAYSKHCVDMSGEDYLHNWEDSSDRIERLRTLVVKLITE